MEKPLVTPHLIIREITLADDQFILKLLNMPSWLKFIGDRNIHTVTDARRYIRTGPLRSYEENGFGAWVVVSKATLRPAGMCGFFKRAYLDVPDLGFAFLPEYEGKGYAREAVTACLDYARTSLGLQSLLAITLPHNDRCISLLERTGFRFLKTIAPQNDESLSLYELKQLF
ncbi:GNAT family N-acetyltransferase [Chitinophaga horti]|uniref:GNAT family N-acetyltransferase n=1 Tax=Chitinophaga horti TaxID=2920382 RepID=A0ABY6IYV0_9BACT|nr:GNAT family N-acetyltransferase [Chitinophaga horti]UYQ91259.1 GNAT family N-acetyltransferase [Chitinophaga horti]